MKGQGIDVNPDLLIKGLRDALSGQKLLMSDDELNTTMSALQQEMNQKQMQERVKHADDNKKTGDAFLADNGKKQGVVTLPSGLQYKILKPAEGKKPTDADTVSCNYRGTLIDGTEFDKSEAGQPATFEVGMVIPGWSSRTLACARTKSLQLGLAFVSALGELDLGQRDEDLGAGL